MTKQNQIKTKLLDKESGGGGGIGGPRGEESWVDEMYKGVSYVWKSGFGG